MNELTKANLREMFHSMSNSDFEIFYNKIMENAFLKEQLQQKEDIIKEIKAQLDYLETYSSKEDVFEDMKRRLNNIEKIIDKENR